MSGAASGARLFVLQGDSWARERYGFWDEKGVWLSSRCKR